MSTKEERKEFLERFMNEPFPKKQSFMDKLKGRNQGAYRYKDLFTLAGCIYKSMAWGHDILHIEMYVDSGEGLIILPKFFEGMLNSVAKTAPIFLRSDLTVGNLVAKSLTEKGGEVK